MISVMPRSVLIVDDDAGFRALARRLLEAVGLTVVGEAGTVAGAIAVATALMPSGALVDIGLPDGDGITLARRLSALPWAPAVLLTSTDPDAASADEVRDAGANAFIAKDQLPSAPLAIVSPAPQPRMTALVRIRKSPR